MLRRFFLQRKPTEGGLYHQLLIKKMARRNEKISMPSSQGGLVRYFGEYKSNIEFKPGYIILFVVLIIIIEILLHTQGYRFLGMN